MLGRVSAQQYGLVMLELASKIGTTEILKDDISSLKLSDNDTKVSKVYTKNKNLEISCDYFINCAGPFANVLHRNCFSKYRKFLLCVSLNNFWSFF